MSQACNQLELASAQQVALQAAESDKAVAGQSDAAQSTFSSPELPASYSGDHLIHCMSANSPSTTVKSFCSW